MIVTDKLVFKLIPIIIFLSFQLYFILSGVGPYRLLAHFMYVPTDGLVYLVASFLVSLFPLFSGSRLDTTAVRYIFAILCFLIIQGILYRVFSIFLMESDHLVDVWVNHFPEMFLAYLFMQFLLLFSKVDIVQMVVGNIIIIMAVLATVHREIEFPQIATVW